jgi:uncharacterized protein Veg
MQVIQAIITLHNGQRVRMTLPGSTTHRAHYHVTEVYPSHVSVQITRIKLPAAAVGAVGASS